MRRIYPEELMAQGWTWRIVSKAREPICTVWTGPNGERHEIDALALVLEIDETQ